MHYPNIVGILVGPKNAKRPTVFLAEVCKIVIGQFYKKKVLDELTSKDTMTFHTMKLVNCIKTIQDGICPSSRITITRVNKGSLQALVSNVLMIYLLADTIFCRLKNTKSQRRYSTLA